MNAPGRGKNQSKTKTERPRMKTTKTTKAFLAGAAIAGLLSGSATRLQAATSVTSPNGSSISPAGVMADETAGTEKDKHGCKGQNGCNGQGGCKSGDNGCKGK